MATRSNKPKEVEEVTDSVATKVVEPEEYKELNLDAKVTVRSIAPWKTGFHRIAEGYGDVFIAPNGTVRLSRNEIIAQIQSGNVLFAGTDGMGSHATLYIEDAPTRREVDFESEDRKQAVFSKELVSTLFANKVQKAFEKDFRKAIRTRAEKFAVMNEIKSAGINDYNKIRFAEMHTGLRMDKI